MNGPTFENTQFKNHCGHIVERDWQYCPVCGTEVVDTENIKEQIQQVSNELDNVKNKNENLREIIIIRKQEKAEEEEEVKKQQKEEMEKQKYKRLIERIDEAEDTHDLFNIGKELYDTYNDLDSTRRCLYKSMEILLWENEELHEHLWDWINLLGKTEVEDEIKSYYDNEIIEETIYINKMMIFQGLFKEIFDNSNMSEKIYDKAYDLMKQEDRNRRMKDFEFASTSFPDVARKWIKYFNDHEKADDILKEGFNKLKKDHLLFDVEDYLKNWLDITGNQQLAEEQFRRRYNFQSVRNFEEDILYIDKVLKIWEKVFYNDNKVDNMIFEAIEKIHKMDNASRLFGLINRNYPHKTFILKSILYKGEEKCRKEQDYNLLALHWSGIDKYEQERVRDLSLRKFY